MEDHAFEDNGIVHLMLHRHELVKQLNNEEKKAHELWQKIGIMLENKNVVNLVLVFRKIVRLRYQDNSKG